MFSKSKAPTMEMLAIVLLGYRMMAPCSETSPPIVPTFCNSGCNNSSQILASLGYVLPSSKDQNFNYPFSQP
ncbi:hypothetical protein EJB05_38574, partial [Eragrostis curvula]